MGTVLKNPEERFQHRMSKKYSVEMQVCIIIREKPSTTWETGYSFKKLKEEVERRNKRKFSKGRIYEAISLINRFGENQGVYLRSGTGWVLLDNNERKKEHRYFIPTESYDLSLEKKDLEYRKEIVELKEKHVEHHEKIIIPNEKKIEQIRQTS